MKPEKTLKKYFWDTDFKNSDIKQYPSFVIERILEYGDKQAIQWMFKNFKKTQIKNTLKKTRKISKKSANYWSSVLSIPKDKVLCLNRSYQKKQKRHWYY